MTAKVPGVLLGSTTHPGAVWSPTPVKPPAALAWSSDPAPLVYLGMTPEGNLVAAVILPSGRVEGTESSYTMPWAAVASEGYDEAESEDADDV